MRGDALPIGRDDANVSGRDVIIVSGLVPSPEAISISRRSNHLCNNEQSSSCYFLSS